MRSLTIRLSLVAVLTLLSVAGTLAGPAWLAVPGGLALAFLLPGFALTGALFARRVLTPLERSVLTPALSMAVMITSGLLLYVAKVGLARTSWTLATAGVTLAALLVELWRHRRPAGRAVREAAEDRAEAEQEEAEEAAVAPSTEVSAAHTVMMKIAPVQRREQRAAEERRHRNRLIRQLLPFLAFAAILGGASWISVTTSLATSDDTITALSAAPPGEAGDDDTREVVVSASGLLAEEGPYTVKVSAVAGDTEQARSVAVTADGTWTETMTIPADERVTIGLYRSGDTSAYRIISISETETVSDGD